MDEQPDPPGRRVAEGLVFGTSAAVLVLEILAVRLLAPYTGLTLETSTAVIGVVLGAIAAGAALGGRLADARGPRTVLVGALVAGGLLALVSLPLLRILGTGTRIGGPGAAVLLTTLCFGPPALVLSAVAPAVAKLRLSSLADSGTVVGRLSAIGTAGALTGTFGTGFVLVAAFPVEVVVVAVGGALMLAGVLLGARPRVLGAAAGPAVLALLAPSPCQVESAYFCAEVQARGSERVLVLDGLNHSAVDLDDPRALRFPYTRRIASVLRAVAPERVLHVGGGGFTIPRWLRATFPGSESVVLELDPEVLALARRELGLVTGPRLRVRTGDARVNIEDEPAGAYDAVVGDAFGGLAVPWHLATREFVEQVARVLRPGGVYVVNVIDFGPEHFARAEAATLGAVFAHVGLLQDGGNLVFVASDEPLPVDAHDGRAFAGDAPVLTDSFAPVDQLLTTRDR